MSKKFTQVKSLADLAAEKKRLRQQIRKNKQTTADLIDNLPVVALQGGADIIIGAIARQFQKKEAEEELKAKEEAFASSYEKVPIGETLKDVGKETAIFAAGQLLDRLLKLK